MVVGFVWRWTGAQGEINRRDEFFCNFENEWQIKIKTKEPGGGGSKMGLEHLIMPASKEVLKKWGGRI